MAKSFWSEGIQAAAEKSPLAVVSEAASQLAKITSGLVEANLRSAGTKTGYLVHRLYIVAPTLGYDVQVASFAHEPTPLYPVWASTTALGPAIYNEGAMMPRGALGGLSENALPRAEPPGTKLLRQPELEAWLGDFLRGQRITDLVNGLLATVNVSALDPIDAEFA